MEQNRACPNKHNFDFGIIIQSLQDKYHYSQKFRCECIITVHKIPIISPHLQTTFSIENITKASNLKQVLLSRKCQESHVRKWPCTIRFYVHEIIGFCSVWQKKNHESTHITHNGVNHTGNCSITIYTDQFIPGRVH